VKASDRQFFVAVRIKQENEKEEIRKLTNSDFSNFQDLGVKKTHAALVTDIFIKHVFASYARARFRWCCPNLQNS
jgi:hypothetical protein